MGASTSDLSRQPSMQEHPPSLIDYAEQCLARAKSLQTLVSAPPTFDKDSLKGLAPEHEELRLRLIDSAENLAALARGVAGPYGRIQKVGVWGFLDIAVMNAILQLDVHTKVPLDGSISYDELANKCGGIDPGPLSRMLRHAMTARLFMEPSQGQIAHTIDSAELALDPTLVDLISMERREQQPASLKWVEWLKTYPFSHAATETPYRLAFDTGPKTFYEWLRKQDHERNHQFNGAMTQLSRAGIQSVKSLSGAYPWSDFPKGAMMVDVGGGNGHVCIALAKNYPHMKFTVQDMPGGSNMDLIDASLADIKQRVQFYAYDYNTPQPVHGATVYFFLNIMHNNPTSAAVQILRNQIPALKNGSRVLIVDYLVREKDTLPQEDYRQTLHLDMMMMQLCNAMERTEEQMKALFEEASKAEQGSETKGRFRWGGVYGLKNSLYMICEGIWEC